MPLREETSAFHAQHWLCELPIATADIERQLQRLLALLAAEVINSNPHQAVESVFSKFGACLLPFTLSEYRSDPVLAIAIHHALRKRCIEHPSLTALVSAYAKVLALDYPAPSSDLALVAYLVRRCGFEILEPFPALNLTLFSATEIMFADRQQTFEMCRLVTMITACGIRPLDIGDIQLVLAPLCVSYALEWDVEAVNALLRTCTYLGEFKGQVCQWALEWLLDQQQSDGRFGLFAPEAGKMHHDPNDWQLYFYPTVGALWCLAEISQPGFLVA